MYAYNNNNNKRKKQFQEERKNMSDSDHDENNSIKFTDDKEILEAAKREGKVCAHATCDAKVCSRINNQQNESNDQVKQAASGDEKKEEGEAVATGKSKDARKPIVILHNEQENNTSAVATTSNNAHNEHLHINTTEEYISIENIRLFYLSDIPLDQLVNCTELEVRKNLIHDLIPFPANLRGQLVKLDLFDNKIKHIAPYFSAAGHPLFQDPRWQSRYPDVTDLTFAKLRVLDLSYNQIKHITGLEALAGTLEELFLVENRIKDIENLGELKKLRLLELGGNQLRAVTAKCLVGLADLEDLWLGKNKIGSLEPGCFAHCPKLRLLSLQANRLTEIPSGVFVGEAGVPAKLEQLHLSENGLKSIANIGPMKLMKIMDFSFNPITTLFHNNNNAATPGVASETTSAANDEGTVAAAATTARTTELTLDNFPELEEFWMTDAKVSDWREISIFAPFEKTLQTIYLERTPLEDDRRYRDKIYQSLPFLTQIDSWPIVNKSNPEADRAIHRR